MTASKPARVNVGHLRGFARSVALVFIAQTFVNLSNFGFHVVVSRGVGVVAYGTLNALISGFQIVQAAALIAVTAIAKQTAELLATRGSASMPGLQKQALVALLGITLSAFLLGLAATPAIVRYLHITSAGPVILMVAITALNFALALRGVFQGMERFLEYSVSLVIEAFSKFGVATALVALGFGIAGALGAWFAGCLVALVYLIVTMNPSVAVSAEKGGLGRRETLASVATIAIVVTGAASLAFSDVVLAKHFLSPFDAGLYSAAALCGKMVYLLVSFVPIVLLPRVTARKASGGATLPYLFRALAATVAMGACAVLFYALLGSFVVSTLAGPRFASAGTYVFPYATISALAAVLNTAVTYQIASDKVRFSIALPAVALLEILAIFHFHSSILQIITVAALANLTGCALVAASLGLRSSRNAPVVT